MESNDHIISLILRACKLARDLESNISNSATNIPPSMLLSDSVDDIISVFKAAKDWLNPETRLADPVVMTSTPYDHDPHLLQIDPSFCLPQWMIRSSSATAMDHMMMTHDQSRDHTMSSTYEISSSPFSRSTHEMGDVQTMGVSEPSAAKGAAPPSSSQGITQRRRKDRLDRRTVRVAVPSGGDAMLPPDHDGFTWRKYGQKEILCSSFPRSYYRCTHQKLYQCGAKKQVQRLDDDPHIFEVTYRGEHICHMSSTAPSIPPPHPPPLYELTHHHHQFPIASSSSSSSSFVQWLSMELSGGRSSASTSTTTLHAGDHHAGPSRTVRYGKEVDHHHQAFTAMDMADSMFNSATHTSNISLDFIFPSMESPSPDDNYKWDQTEKPESSN